MWNVVAREIAAATGVPFHPRERRSVGGGCINGAVVLADATRRYFVKTNDAARLSMFEAEADGLREIAASATVRVPTPVCQGSVGESAFLVLEYLEMTGGDHGDALGHPLAAMHRITAPRFGWHRDNTIGATPQPNGWSDDWVQFFGARRLGYQIHGALEGVASARLRELGEELIERLPALFVTYRPVASLLHGDLWSGNAGATSEGEPVIFDPAVYYGDREADLAMTELFGGYSARFYSAYREAWPLDPGYGVRKDLYNLYHVLNHYALFGGGYGRQAEALMGRLLGELR